LREKEQMIRGKRAALVTLTFLCGWASAPLSANAPPSADPMTVVRSGVQQVIRVFNDRQMALDQRREKLRSMSRQYIDFDSMAKSALGPHWRKLTQSQRDEFIPVFADFIQDAYLSQLQQATVEKVRQEANSATVRFIRETYFGADYAEVDSSVALPNQNGPLKVNFLMHRNAGRWRVYDISIDSIGIVANYRNQFNRVINRDGYGALVSDLKAKLQQLQHYMNQEAHSSAAP
jgi:phospholipid transport system substrate-binding protein